MQSRLAVLYTPKTSFIFEGEISIFFNGKRCTSAYVDYVNGLLIIDGDQFKTGSLYVEGANYPTSQGFLFK